MTINATAADPARALRRGGREAGRPARTDRRHDPERHPQGVHRARHVHLPAAAVDAPRDRHLRVLRARAAPLEHDLDQRLPHARGGSDGRPGARVHARQRHRVRRGRRRARPRRRRIRRPAELLLRRLERAVRGGGQVPRRPPDVGAHHAGSLRRNERPVDDVPLPRPDRRLQPDRPVGRQQRRADDDPGTRSGPGRRPEPPHERPRRGARPADGGEPRAWRSGRSRSSPTRAACRRRPIRWPARTSSRRSPTSSRRPRRPTSTRSTRWAVRSPRSRPASSSARSRRRHTASSAIERGERIVVGVNRFRDDEVHTPALQRIDPRRRAAPGRRASAGCAPSATPAAGRRPWTDSTTPRAAATT